ncbi:MAG: hypothetical protein HC903_04155 [Methylacidiphilales bacterium]|nr:hypothetical protein [Candidatus Methylacidiphilales bacterium]
MAGLIQKYLFSHCFVNAIAHPKPPNITLTRLSAFWQTSFLHRTPQTHTPEAL